MTRTDAIARVRQSLHSGEFLRELDRRVAYPTESQNAGRDKELRAYLENELQPVFTQLGFSSRLIESPTGKAPYLLADYRENASSYFPDDPALQALLVAQQANPGTAVTGLLTQYPSDKASGFTGNAHAAIDYRVSTNLHLGGRFDYEHSGNFDDASGVVYAKYVFSSTGK